MKNIHLIKTDKPSRLWSNNLRRRLELDEFPSQHATNIAKHIYITSDEEIKPNVYALINKVLCKTELLEGKIVSRQLVGGATMDICKSEYLEIILTTDQDLIKDGVQTISNEFLEWFVKNPSCEEVEIEQEKSIGYAGDRQRTFYGKYKIIIPKEEPTAYHYLSCCRSIEECHCGKYPKQIKCYCGHTIMCDCSPIDEPKQETLEETAEKYSEEDMKQAYLDGCKIKLTNIYHLEKWFEKFKKK